MSICHYCKQQKDHGASLLEAYINNEALIRFVCTDCSYKEKEKWEKHFKEIIDSLKYRKK